TPVEAPKDPANSTIVSLYRLFARPEEVAAMEEDFRAGGFGYGDFKKKLFEIIWERVGPMRRRREELLANPDHVDEILATGAARARKVAEQTISRVRNAVGIVSPACHG